MNSKVIDVVCTIYNDEQIIPRLTEEIARYIEPLGLPYRVIYVCDGSPDKSWQVLEQVIDTYPNVCAIELSRNFGQHIAISAGLDFSDAEYVIVMDSDLEDPPSAIPEIISKLQDENYDIVYTRHISRKDKLAKRTSSEIFWRVFRFLIGPEIVVDQLMLRGMSRRYVKAFTSIREHSRFVGGLSAWLGFKQGVIDVESGVRTHGKSNYNLRRLIGLSLDAATSLSLAPLRFATVLGFIVTASSMFYAAYIVGRVFFGPPLQAGFATLTLMISFFSGVTILILGILGEYIGRTLREAQLRPLYFVRQVKGAGIDKERQHLPLPPYSFQNK